MQQQNPSKICPSNVVGQFWINGNTPSSKNNKMWTGKFLTSSKATKNWKKESEPDWTKQYSEFTNLVKDMSRPLYIELTFYRYSRRKFDYINMAQAVFDAMQYHGWIEGDDVTVIMPYFGDAIHDPNNPGTLIRVLKEKPEHYDISKHIRTS